MNIAADWADKFIHQIVAASHSPDVRLEGDDLLIYSELKEWGWFEQFPLEDEKSEKATRLMLTMRKYAKVKWAKDHPTKQTQSKWQKVYGRQKKT